MLPIVYFGAGAGDTVDIPAGSHHEPREGKKKKSGLEGPWLQQMPSRCRVPGNSKSFVVQQESERELEVGAAQPDRKLSRPCPNACQPDYNLEKLRQYIYVPGRTDYEVDDRVNRYSFHTPTLDIYILFHANQSQAGSGSSSSNLDAVSVG